MSNLNEALRYLEHGLSVIPLWSPDILKNKPPKRYREEVARIHEDQCLNDDEKEKRIQDLYIRTCKQPIVPWAEYQTRLPTREEVTDWFTQNPSANIGIVTGAVSGLVVFDLDSQEAEQYAEDEGGFSDTAKVKTGKGHHIYMKHPGFEIRNSVNKKLDIDIRADGGYVAAPPSIHGNGSAYEWVDGFSIFEIDPDYCTPWMIDYLESVAEEAEKKSKEKPPKVRKPKKKTIEESEKTSVKKEFQNILRDGCSEGERNYNATRLIGHWLGSGMDPDEAREMALMWNQKNQPPLDESEVRSTFEYILKSEKKQKSPAIKIDDLLDNQGKIFSEYKEKYLRIPFKGDSLLNLQNQMNGGLVGGRLYTLGGIPSSGKTLLQNQMADNICLNDHPVLLLSLDDGRTELRYRTFSRFSTHTIEEFNTRRVPTDKIKEICEYPTIKKINKMKYVVDHVISIEKWDEIIKQIDRRHQKKPVIIIDYLRKLRTNKRSSDERLRVDHILLELTDLAKKHNIPIVAISELARDSYKTGQRLSMASFKESGTIEYEASWLGILACVKEDKNGKYVIVDNWEKIIEQDGIVDLIVFKAKRGTGQTGRVPLKIDKIKMTVSDRKDFGIKDNVHNLSRNNRKPIFG